LAFFFAAGTWNAPRGILYFLLYTLASVVACLILYRGHAETLDARREVPKSTKSWDKIILPLFVLSAYYGIAGLSVRFDQPQTPSPLFWLGMAVMLACCFLSVWPVMVNRNFESSARIQEDRRQAVCSTGPYAFVRHPGYSVLILWALSMPVMFGFYAGIISTVIIALIVVRTYLEDSMLKNELPGYKNYMEKVKYRLLPYVW
jgi:Putative protein-S-isoprenylcysteine methyltransferase